MIIIASAQTKYFVPKDMKKKIAYQSAIDTAFTEYNFKRVYYVCTSTFWLIVLSLSFRAFFDILKVRKNIHTQSKKKV